MEQPAPPDPTTDRAPGATAAATAGGGGGAGPDARSTGAEKAPTFVEQARRRQIVDAAVATLAELGYAKTSFARIAERAGISPALISYHFATKDRLLRQVVVDITAAMDRAITAEVGDAPSYRIALRRMIEAQVRYFAEHTTEVLALGHIFGRGGDDSLGDDLADDRSRTLAELEGMFSEGQAEGEFRSFALRPMAVTLLAALEAVPGELLRRDGTDVDAYASALADIFDAAVRR